MSHSKTKIQSVWDKASKVRGKDPTLYRKDTCGNIIFKHSYGKRSTMGWELDHIIARARGGSNEVKNLQALQWRTNRTKNSRKGAYCPR